LIAQLPYNLTTAHRDFLLSMVRAEPEWRIGDDGIHRSARECRQDGETIAMDDLRSERFFSLRGIQVVVGGHDKSFLL